MCHLGDSRDSALEIDILASSRDVRVAIGGVMIAESHLPRLLFETNLPTRHYLPKIDVRTDLLEPSQTTTRCPYKGTAEYYSPRIGDTLHPDIAWSYLTPFPENQKIAELIAFHDKKGDLIVADARH